MLFEACIIYIKYTFNVYNNSQIFKKKQHTQTHSHWIYALVIAHTFTSTCNLKKMNACIINL